MGGLSWRKLSGFCPSLIYPQYSASLFSAFWSRYFSPRHLVDRPLHLYQAPLCQCRSDPFSSTKSSILTSEISFSAHNIPLEQLYLDNLNDLLIALFIGYYFLFILIHSYLLELNWGFLQIWKLLYRNRSCIKECLYLPELLNKGFRLGAPSLQLLCNKNAHFGISETLLGLKRRGAPQLTCCRSRSMT